MGPLCRGRRRRARRFAVVLLRSRFPAARRRCDAEDARPDQDSGGGFYIFIFVADGGRASGARRAAAARSVGSIPHSRADRWDPYGVRRTRRRVPGLPFPEQRRHRCGVCGPGALPLRGLISRCGGSRGWRSYGSGWTTAGRLRQRPLLAEVVGVAHSRAPRVGRNRGIMRNSNASSGRSRAPMCIDPPHSTRGPPPPPPPPPQKPHHPTKNSPHPTQTPVSHVQHPRHPHPKHTPCLRCPDTPHPTAKRCSQRMRVKSARRVRRLRRAGWPRGC